LVLSYQGLEEETLDQKSPGPPGWGLMQRASSSLITKKQKNAKKPNTKASDKIDRRNREVLPLGITALEPQSYFHLGTPYIYIDKIDHNM
jgi:hypothetical protein